MSKFYPGIGDKAAAEKSLSKISKEKKKTSEQKPVMKKPPTEEDFFVEAPDKFINVDHYDNPQNSAINDNEQFIPANTSDHEKPGCVGCVSMGGRKTSRRRRRTNKRKNRKRSTRKRRLTKRR